MLNSLILSSGTMIRDMLHDESSPVRDAHDDLQYIRRTLAAAGHLSTIPGRGIVSIGILALIVVVLNLKLTGAPWEDSSTLPRSLGVWAALLVISLAIGVWTMSRKARRIGQVFWSPVLRKALWGYASGMLLGGILTVAVIRGGALQFLPMIWLGCYGVAILSAGAMSVSPVRWMGVCFLLLAAVASWLDTQFFGLPLLAVGFGWLHISFGTYIAWRHDG